MTAATNQLARPKAVRWFYRTDKGDFGPVSTDELLDAIKSRAVDLSTEVKRVGSNEWTVAADERIFRDHYATCRAHWDEQALTAETDRLGKRLQRAQTRRKSAWIIVLAGAIAVIGVAAFVWWRLSQSEPIGVADLLVADDTASLPMYTARVAEPLGFPTQNPRRVALLQENELLDTAGVRVGGSDGAVAQRFEFNESGEVAEIPPDVLASVTEQARQGLVQCARQLAVANPNFSGTDVGFSVASKGITNISVGKEVAGSATFRACVKSALTRVRVPAFQAAPRRVTVPLKVGR